MQKKNLTTFSPIFDKTPRKLRIERNFHNPIEGVYGKYTNIISNAQVLNIFPLVLGTQ